MKITRTVRTLEITVHETSVTTRRKRTIVRRGGETGDAKRILEIEERTAEIPTITTEPDGSSKHN